ncbi:MAG: 4-hydroxythreonine-4-phosphate dehydrogenase, partial [bacterium]
MSAGPAPLALSMGDPAGVGPEIIAKAWAALRVEGPSFVVIGDAALLRLQGQPVEPVLSAADATDVF